MSIESRQQCAGLYWWRLLVILGGLLVLWSSLFWQQPVRSLSKQQHDTVRDYVESLTILEKVRVEKFRNKILEKIGRNKSGHGKEENNRVQRILFALSC